MVVAMNIRSTDPRPLPESPKLADKRAELQALILKKTLDENETQVQEQAREATGKGRLIDLRV